MFFFNFTNTNVGVNFSYLHQVFLPRATYEESQLFSALKTRDYIV